jgi:thiamine biosynthesis protein ThiS
MKITIDGKEISTQKGSTVFDVLTTVKINPETVLVKKGRTLIPQDETLYDGDVLELITVISGG